MTQPVTKTYSNVRLTLANYERLRVASFHTRRTQTDIVNQAVQQWLDHLDRQEKQPN